MTECFCQMQPDATLDERSIPSHVHNESAARGCSIDPRGEVV